MNLEEVMQRMTAAVDTLVAVDLDTMSVYEQRDYMEELTQLQRQLDDVTRVLTKPILREIEPPVVDIVRNRLRPAPPTGGLAATRRG